MIRQLNSILMSFFMLIWFFYFKLNIMASRYNPLVTLEHSKSFVKYVVLPSACENKDVCCNDVANNWITLNINGNFNMHSVF